MRMCLILMLVSMIGLVSCKNGPAAAEPFARDRLGQLARALESARDAQRSAQDHLDRLITDTDGPALQGLSSDAAYDLTRRGVLRSESRISSAKERYKHAQFRGTELLSQWDRELGRYEDPDLRHAAEANIEAVAGRFRGTMKALEAGLSALEPAHRLAADRLLHFSHHRDQAEAVNPAATEGAQSREKAVVDGMHTQVSGADQAVTDFVLSIRRTPQAR